MESFDLLYKDSPQVALSIERWIEAEMKGSSDIEMDHFYEHEYNARRNELAKEFMEYEAKDAWESEASLRDAESGMAQARRDTMKSYDELYEQERAAYYGRH